MKKFLFMGALAAMLLGTASCSNDMEPEMTDDGTVQFTIELPGNVDSRAISDGTIATDLQVAVYKEDGTLLNISRLGEESVTMSGKQATVTFKLVKGLTYKFAFWAQKPGCEAYAFNASTGKVTVDYSKAVANADDGDAFSNTATLTVTGPMTETIYLHRPFAQLNYGDVMEDYAAATAAGIDFKQTVVTVKQVATEFDIMNQTTSGDNLVDITWPAAASAIADENLNVEDVNYKWLSMCYFLVPNDEATVNTELSLLNNAGTEFNKLTVDNVPVQKKHRTNILGNLFTDDVNFNIIIDERFDQPDNNIVMLSDAAAIAEAVTVPNAVVNIEPGTNVNLDLSTIDEGVTINGNGATIAFTTSSTENAHKVINDNVTINNCKIDNKDNRTAITVNANNFTIQDCEFTDCNYKYGIQLNGGSDDGNILINNCKLANRVGRAIYINNKSDVTIKDCLLDATYPINTGTADCDVVVENTTMLGWTSINNGSGNTISFKDCTFGKGTSGYQTIRPYQTTTFENCTFKDGMSYQPRPSSNGTPTASTCIGCTIENQTKFLAIDSTEQTAGVGCTITIDGVTYINNGGDHYVQQQ